MTRKPLAIIQMGRPPEDLRRAQGEQADWMLAALDDPDLPVRICKPHDDEALPAWDALAGAVLTGSWSMVTDREPWSERTAEWLRGAHRAQLPLLGICYGHQLMAHALGGVVDFHPKAARSANMPSIFARTSPAMRCLARCRRAFLPISRMSRAC